MNRHRHHAQSNRLIIFALLLGVAVCASGGVRYAIAKNRQTTLERLADAAERRAEKYRLDIRTVEMRSDELVSYFVLTKTLKENHSALCSIPTSAVEEINPSIVSTRSVASVSP